MTDAPPVGVAASIPEELGAILSRARDVRRERGGFFRARIGAEAVVFAAIGDGALRARRGVAALCEIHRPKVLVGVGVAGSLSEEFGPGELVVARRVRDSSGEAPAPDERLLARALSLPGLRASTLLSTAGPVVTRAGKAALAGAQSAAGPVAVDMESSAWARESAARRIPYLVVRAISDGVHEELPGYLPDCMDAEGSIRRSRVVLHALANPSSIPTLLSMRRRVREAAFNLAAFLEHFLREPL